MNPRLVELIDESGNIEIHVVGFDTWADFTSLTLELSKRFSLENEFDGLYSRYSIFRIRDLMFKMIFHEDIGNYVLVEDLDKQSTDIIRDHLRSILESSGS